MRKLLLGTTALAAAATLSANAALADVSISGYYEFAYQGRGSEVAANDGTTMSTDSEIHVKFSNKTDSGLTIGMVTEIETDDTDTNINEGSLSIAGGFGKFVLGGNDGAGDNYGIDAQDVVSEDINATGTDTLALLDTDLESTAGDSNKITYHIPAMGGLTAGFSLTDDGSNATTGNQNTTSFGAQYAMEAGGAAITIGGGSSTTEQVSGTVDIESQNIGIKVVSGDITVIGATASYEATNADEEAKFKVNDAMSIGAYTVKVSDATGTTDEEYTNTGAEVTYSIASGLTAYINIEDYDYKTGTGTGSGTTADNGTVSKLTIKATF